MTKKNNNDIIFARTKGGTAELRNILIIGWDEEDGRQIMKCLVRLLPEDMRHFSYKVYETAPVDAIHGEPAPYIEIMDDDMDRARRIVKALQEDIDSIDGPPDVQILKIEFHESTGIIHEDNHR